MPVEESESEPEALLMSSLLALCGACLRVQVASGGHVSGRMFAWGWH